MLDLHFHVANYKAIAGDTCVLFINYNQACPEKISKLLKEEYTTLGSVSWSTIEGIYIRTLPHTLGYYERFPRITDTCIHLIAKATLDNENAAVNNIKIHGYIQDLTDSQLCVDYNTVTYTTYNEDSLLKLTKAVSQSVKLRHLLRNRSIAERFDFANNQGYPKAEHYELLLNKVKGLSPLHVPYTLEHIAYWLYTKAYEYDQTIFKYRSYLYRKLPQWWIKWEKVQREVEVYKLCDYYDAKQSLTYFNNLKVLQALHQHDSELTPRMLARPLSKSRPLSKDFKAWRDKHKI